MSSPRSPQRGRRLVAALAAVPLVLTVAATAASAAPRSDIPQPVVQTRSKDVITSRGLQFRDLNANGRVDVYEDWRNPIDWRVADLVERMTLEEKAGLMLIDTFNATDGGGVDQARADNYIGTQRMHRFVFRNRVVTPAEAAATSTTAVSPSEAATFMNSMQQLSEETRLGIPALFKSNARNHIDPNARFGINEDVGGMAAFPKEAGIASAALGAQAAAGQTPTDGDMGPVETFAAVMGEEWSAFGLRGMYGYMADLSTEPRWYRTHETFTEDADLMANIARTLVQTLQGPVDANGDSLSPDTDVALTMKHFPGGGPQELGFDPHYAFGKTQVYPNDGFGYNLMPFQAAIDAGVSSIMPYYGAPMDVTYEGVTFPETGFAFSDSIVNGLLRDSLGFRGYVNSDTGIINDRAWGLEHNTVPERVAAAVNGGTDTLSGFNNAQVILELVADGLVTEARVDLAAQRLLTPMFQMGLFENPYVDAAAADSIVGSPENLAVGLQLQRDSLVLLENKTAADGNTVLPLRSGATVYTLGGFDIRELENRGFTVINGETENPADRPSAEDADVVLVSLTAFADGTSNYRSDDPALGMNPDHISPIVMPGIPGLDGKSPYGAADVCVWDPTQNCTDNGLRFGGAFPWESSILDFTGMQAAESWEVSPGLDVIQQVMAEVGDPSKVVLDVYFRQPYVLDVASGLRDAGAIVADFGVSDTALMDVLTGAQDFAGRMPFALAGTPEAILEQYSDTPGYDETTDGALYRYGYGWSYAQGATDSGTPGDGDIPVVGVIPGTGPGEPGSLTMTIPDAAAGVDLGEAVRAGDAYELAGTLPSVLVTDTRTGGAGWSTSGQAQQLTSEAGNLSASYLGWAPQVRAGTAGVAAGPVRAGELRGGPGLAVPARLASSDGTGPAAIVELGANVDLRVPVTTVGGTYRSNITLSLFPTD